MPQETNLNNSPYFDDFNRDNEYYRVLFKPGTPVQSRELTTLQSILQNQIEQFGKHFFKEGSKVIPGNLSYDNEYFCVEIEPTFSGIDVGLYLDRLVGRSIRGLTSGVTATVRKVLPAAESERGTNTLYIQYRGSNASNLARREFSDGENIVSNSLIRFGSRTIPANQPFGRTIASNSTSIASAMSIGDGVYFVRGLFVEVQNQTLILDQYAPNPSYRIGFDVIERIVTADEDPRLNDNAQGFSNYAAPGADRLKISLILSKRQLESFEDKNFIEIARVEDGILQSFKKDTQYSLIRDELAKRTFDESGDYYIKPFDVFVKESLNDREGNKGVYLPSQKTDQGNDPSEGLLAIEISPGKAYVKGYDIEKIASSILDVPKARDTKQVKNLTVSINCGTDILLNNVYGSASIGIGTTAKVELLSNRMVGSSYHSTGTAIGEARVYDFNLNKVSYLNQATTFKISLFDIEVYTELELNSNISFSESDFIEGNRSGASGFVVSSTSNSKLVKLTSTAGEFYRNEQIKINGIVNGRIIIKTTDYNINDVKALRSSVGIETFSADTLLGRERSLNSQSSSTYFITKTGVNSGIITAPTRVFTGIVTTGDILSYRISGLKVPTYNVVTGVSTDGDTINVSGVSNVPNVCDGAVQAGTVNNLILSSPIIDESDNSLTTPLPHNNIKDVNITSSQIQIRRRFDNLTISSGSITSPTAGTDLVFQPFNVDRYFISYDDGTIERLTPDKFSISANKKTVTFKGLSKTTGKADLLATLLKNKIRLKEKTLQKASTLVLTRSELTSSKSSVDGLTFNRIYGTRVQDQKISLNVCDAVDLLGVFESDSNSDPDLPGCVLTSFTGPTANTNGVLIGEKIIGENSDAVAIIAEKPTTSSVRFVYLNDNIFTPGEKVTFENSGISALVSSCSKGDKNITNYYSLSSGVQPTFYDYSYITRKKDSPIPSKRLKIVFNHFIVEQSDNGDFFAVSSYAESDKKYLSRETVLNKKQDAVIDIRPRVSNYSTSSSFSPFDFDGRSFISPGASISDPLSNDEYLILDYEYYLSRIDRVYLDKDGKFLHQKGVSALNPSEPKGLDEALELASLEIPAYTYSAADVTVTKTSHKRYRMVDIAKLEDRISNIEYYTQLSLLETETSNLKITDTSGLDRFKSGFFVDNFRSHESHNLAHPDFEASIDRRNGELRPSHYTTAVDLLVGSESLIGIGSTANPDVDANFINDIDGSNIKKSGRILTLNYTEVPVVTQRYASRVENVNPFLIVFYQGTLELSPQSDVWIDQKRIAALNPQLTKFYDDTIRELGINPQTGFGPTEWGSWETYWSSTRVTGSREVPGSRQTSTTTIDWGNSRNPAFVNAGVTQTTANWPGWRTIEQARDAIEVMQENGTLLPISRNTLVPSVQRTGETDIRTTSALIETTTQTTARQSREGIQTQVTPSLQSVNLGDRIVSRDIIPYMRSRNIEFRISRLKPNTRFYVFFDGINVTKYCTPKFIEITMKSGSSPFRIGEIVEARLDLDGDKKRDLMTFRVAHPQHLEGPYNAPTDFIGENPYNDGTSLGNVYTSTSNVLNVDIFSLSAQITEFNGYLVKGIKLIGKRSGAEATVKDLRLVSDDVGDLYGSLFIPDPNLAANPRWETGSKTIRFTTSETNSKVGGIVQSSAEATFYSQGEQDTVQGTTLSVKFPIVEEIQRQDTRTTTTTDRTRERDVIAQSSTTYYDPLAQSFAVDEATGIFVTSVDVYFRTKDTTLPVSLQIREMRGGTPTTTILPFSVVKMMPNKINVSEDASVPTKFTFSSPVYLAGPNVEYAVVLVSPSDKYEAWISRMGEIDISTLNNPNRGQLVITQQPYLGSLFKSQNGSTWDPSQLEDLKLTIYKAQFNIQPGIVRFYNPELHKGNKQLIKLDNNPIQTLSRRAVVGLGTTFVNGDLTPGVTVSQQGNTTATGILVSTAGAVATGSASLTITNAGIGYTPSSGSLTYPNVPLVVVRNANEQTTTSERGSDLVGIVTVTNGSVSGITVTQGGKNFVVGDVVGISSIGDGNGAGARFSVGIISARNAIVLKDIQGQFNIGVNTVTFTDPDTLVSSAITTNCLIQSIDYNDNSDGLHFKVKHRSHAMHSFANLVEISDIDSDVRPTRVTEEYAINSTSSLVVTSTTNFTTFEGIGVGATNPGYIFVDGEIMRYTGTTATSLTGITRGIDSTLRTTHEVNSSVFKYEFKGVSLRRINKTHNMTFTTVPDAIDLDYYHVKIDTSTNGTNRSSGVGFPKLYFTRTASGGGNSVYASQNMQFETLTPNIQSMLPSGTNISGRVRTISATSIDGLEESFVDQGFTEINLTAQNNFPTPRMIASRVNEDFYLSSLPANKSLTMELIMTSNNRNISPVIDLDRVSVITTTNRLNDPIVDWASNELISRNGQDPCIATYVSKIITLENPASSLKVLLAAVCPATSDIRVMYKIQRIGSTTPFDNEIFRLFPGYDNIDSEGNIERIEKCDGLPDTQPRSSGLQGVRYTDYAYSANSLAPFTKFQIKIDMTGTNQAAPPKIKDLRTIALA
jgi:hypothetical protein